MEIKLFSDFSLQRKRAIFILQFSFFLLSFVEIFAEYEKNSSLLWLTKPLLLPILIVLYVVSSQVKSSVYILALLFNWLANVLFISKQLSFVFGASLFFILYRIVIVSKLFRDIRLSALPILIGAIPFFFIFLSLISIVYDAMQGVALVLSIIQIVLITIVGGFSVANYSLNAATKSSFLLLISTLFFTVNLFLLGIKFYYQDFDFIKPLSMSFFVVGQYMFYQYTTTLEKEKALLYL